MADGLPATMRAVVLTGFGGFDRLELRDDVPVPRPGPGEVLVRVSAAGVNNTDINTRIGWYSKAVDGATDAGADAGFAEAQDDGWSGEAFAFPRIQGADAVGRIAAVGEGMDPARLGERVLIEPVFRDEGGGVRYFGSECDGAFAEYAAVPAAHAHKVTCDLDDVALAAVPCSWSAAENMVGRARIAAGERVLVTGASGGVGSAAVQLAARRGARVTALCEPAKTAALAGMGAAEVLGREAPLGDGAFDAVIDVVGGSAFPRLLIALRPGGRYAVAGAIAGPLVELDLRMLYLKDLTLIGCTVLDPGVFPSLVGYLERDEVRPMVAATYPLERIVEAQRAFLEKRHVGKIVLTL